MESLEKVAEAAFGKAIRKWAGERKIKLEYVKFTGAMGYPDRIVIWQGGHLIWIEWKRKGEKPRPLQVHIHQLLRSMGHEVLVYDDWTEALDYVKEKIAETL